MSGSRGRLATAGLTVASMLLVSRLLGWVRVAVLAATFGTGPDLDAFYAAFRIPDLVFQLLAAGSLASALLPILGTLLANGERARAWRLASTITNVVLVALTVLAAVFALFAPAIVPLLAPGYTPEVQAETVVMTRIMVLSPILLGLGSVATAVLNVQGRFSASALAPILYNLGIIAGALFLTPILGARGLAVGVVLGALGNLVVQLVPLRRMGVPYHPAIDPGDPLARRVVVLLAPRMLGQGVNQITFLLVTTLASGLGIGAVTQFNFAYTIALVPLGLIGLPLGIVVFPTLVQHRATRAHDEYIALVGRSLRLLTFLVLPITALTIILRTEIVTLLLGYGRLSGGDIGPIAAALTTLAFGLLGQGCDQVLSRAHFAKEDTRTPALSAIVAVGVNLLLAPPLSGTFGLLGIGLSMAIADTTQASILVVSLARGDSLDLRPLGAHFVRVVAACLVAAGAAVWVAGALAGQGPEGRIGALVVAVVTTLAFGAVYVAVNAVINRSELAEVVEAFPVPLVRRRAAPGGLTARPAGDADRAAIDRFVAGRPEADILQAWAWGEANGLTGEWPRRVVVERDGVLLGTAQILFRRTALGRSVGYVAHGPVWDREAAEGDAVLEALLEGVRAVARSERALVVKVDPRAHHLDAGDGTDAPAVAGALRRLGLRQARRDLQARTTRILDIERDREARVAGWTKEARNRWRRARKEGTTVAIVDVPDERVLDEFHDLLVSTAGLQGFRLRAREFLGVLASDLRPEGRCYIVLAFHDGRPVAGRFVAAVGDRAFSLYRATDRSAPRVSYGHYAAMGALLERLAEDGVRTLDMWGVAEPGDPEADPAWASFSEFKLRFGGRPLRHPGTFDLIVDPARWAIRDAREWASVRVRSVGRGARRHA